MLAYAEPLLLQLYTDEAAAEALAGGEGLPLANTIDFESRPNGVRPLLALLAANTATRIQEAVAARGGGAPRQQAVAAAAPLAPFLRSAVKLLAAIQDEVATAVGEPETQGSDDEDDAADAGGPKLGEVRAVNRFDHANSVGWGYGGSADSIGFTCDTAVWISGFGLYGGTGEYTVKIYLVDGDGSAITDETTIAKLDDLKYEAGTDEPQQLLFSSPVLIEADHRYTAFAEIRGGSSHSGSGGMADREADDGVKFRFEGSSGSTNGSSVDSGQIPQILYQRELPKAASGAGGGAAKKAGGAKPKGAAAAPKPPKAAVARGDSGGSVVGVGGLFGGPGSEEGDGGEDEEEAEDKKPELPKPAFGGGFGARGFGGFGAPAAPAAPAAGFGGFGIAPAAPGGFAFGAPAGAFGAPVAAPAFGSFGAAPAAPAAPGGFAFGGPAAAPAFGAPFGGFGAAAGKPFGLFGGPAAAKPVVFGAPAAGGGLFGGLKPFGAPAPAAPAGLFGAPAPAAPAGIFGAPLLAVDPTSAAPAPAPAQADGDAADEEGVSSDDAARAAAAAQAARQARLLRFCALARSFLSHAATVLDLAAAASLPIAPEPYAGSDRVPLPRAVRAVIETDPVFGELLPRTLVCVWPVRPRLPPSLLPARPAPPACSCTSPASSSRTRSPPPRCCRC